MNKIIIVLLITNFVTFAAFGIDKRKAKNGRWRISEKALLLMGRCFGGIGQLAGMKFFHHKTHKWYFVVTAYLYIAIQIGILIFIYTKSIV